MQIRYNLILKRWTFYRITVFCMYHMMHDWMYRRKFIYKKGSTVLHLYFLSALLIPLPTNSFLHSILSLAQTMSENALWNWKKLISKKFDVQKKGACTCLLQHEIDFAMSMLGSSCNAAEKQLSGGISKSKNFFRLTQFQCC